jgi:hypothetical protein
MNRLIFLLPGIVKPVDDEIAIYILNFFVKPNKKAGKLGGERNERWASGVFHLRSGL